MCDRWCGCEKYREYIKLWVKYRKSNRKLKIYIVPSLIWVYMYVYMFVYVCMYSLGMLVHICMCVYVFHLLLTCLRYF